MATATPTNIFSKFTAASAITSSDRLIASVWATPKCGKTTFVVGNPSLGITHWPLPIFLLNFDLGLTELLGGMDPNARDMTFVLDTATDTPVPSLDEITQKLHEAEAWTIEALKAIREYGSGTIALDTASTYYDWVKAVELPTIEQKLAAEGKKFQRFHYKNSNLHFRNFVQTCKASGANVVLLHHAEEIYDEKGMATGLYRQRGNKQVDELVQVKAVLTTTDIREKGVVVGKSRQGKVQIVRFPEKDYLLYQPPTPNLDYAQLYEMVFDRPPGD